MRARAVFPKIPNGRDRLLAAGMPKRVTWFCSELYMVSPSVLQPSIVLQTAVGG